MNCTLRLFAVVGLVVSAALPIRASLINGSFEAPTVGAKSILYSLEIPGWKTTDTKFEIWSSGARYLWDAFDGNQYAELNYLQAATLYQEVAGIAAGQRVGFQFAHRARPAKDDTAAERATDRVDTMNFTLTDLGANGLFGDGDDTVLFTKNYSDHTTAWGFYTAANEAPIITLGHTVRFAYTAVDSAAPSYGNFLDAADFGVGVGGVPTPDGGTTVAMLAAALASLSALRRKFACG
jgi:hypothetical protein